MNPDNRTNPNRDRTDVNAGPTSQYNVTINGWRRRPGVASLLCIRAGTALDFVQDDRVGADRDGRDTTYASSPADDRTHGAMF